MIEAKPLPAWYVVFQDADAIWVHRWLKPGFRHCWAFAWDEGAARWLVFDPLFDGIYLRTVDEAALSGALAQPALASATIVLAPRVGARSTRPHFMATCVTAIAALLGLGARRALTPHGLYRTLLAEGAVVVKG